ncbi:MAG: aminodeoxychorismate synthase component I [Candidatus Nitrospinota bacterium M3_3B_026]
MAHTKKRPWADPAAVFASLKSAEGLAWLDSGMRLGRTGRWSYIAFAPFAVIRPAGGAFKLSGEMAPMVSGDPFQLMDEAFSAFRLHDAVNGDSPPFKGGAIGFLGYELSRFVEPSAAVRRRAAQEGDIWLGLYDRLIAFDHDRGEASLVACVEEGEDPGPAFSALEKIMSAVRGMAPEKPVVSPAGDARAPVSDFSKQGYMAAVRRVREYIEQGDCYQVNISQRFQAVSPDDPKDVYMRLRSISPAPYAAYIDTGEARILSSSPECFLTLDGGRVTTRPIKGTRRRGRTPEEDTRLSRELAESEKERAENIMIVDLLRNDLSRVCLPGTVAAPGLCEVEKFPTVLHLTSTVEGRLKPGLGAVDLLRAAFPGGSVTGAPKIRAMEIIDEIEPVPRGVYCGAIGWIGFGGGMDMSVAIRVMAERGGLYTFHAGGGVTYPSDPAAEYQETLDKAAAMARALG